MYRVGTRSQPHARPDDSPGRGYCSARPSNRAHSVTTSASRHTLRGRADPCRVRRARRAAPRSTGPPAGRRRRAPPRSGPARSRCAARGRAAALGPARSQVDVHRPGRPSEEPGRPEAWPRQRAAGGGSKSASRSRPRGDGHQGGLGGLLYRGSGARHRVRRRSAQRSSRQRADCGPGQWACPLPTQQPPAGVLTAGAAADRGYSPAGCCAASEEGVSADRARVPSGAGWGAAGEVASNAGEPAGAG